MLLRLSLQNFALFRTVELEWGPTLNILTGETGAGKSLLLESLSILLGYRGELPPLEGKAVIEAEFAPIPPAVVPLLSEPATSLILRCELSPSGRRRFFLNDSPVSAASLREIAYYLVEIHSQHESQQIFQANFQRELLDEYAEIGEELKSYQELYGKWKELRAILAEREKGQEERKLRLQSLLTQLEELEAARLSAEEYAELETQVRRLEHQAQIIQTLSQWAHYLSEGSQAPISLLKEAQKAMGRLPLPEVSSIQSHIETARIALQEALSGMETILQEMSLEPEEAERLRQRYDFYNTLLLKYRCPTIEALIDLRNRLQTEYTALSEVQESIAPLRRDLEQLTAELLERAYRLELARIAAAHTLSDHVQSYLAELGLGYAHFHIAVERITDPQSPYHWESQPVVLGPHGFSSITFLLRTAVQFPLAPLSQVASGGELSRIMLALKAALAEKVQLPTLILDEIDTGLSGEGARRMGEFLAQLAERFQIILITHLPAIAAQRGKHFYLYKEEKDNRWETSIRQLSESERIIEIARLLGGEAAGKAALAAARELLSTAR
ncbi:MAG: DNA repair protein RecN [Bacteroidia bacterium]|nr:DNA repair protein RecN [Bacteroidia bacterium]MDW8014830.1 DNA repair protein RecN [Bacteroidia bacterium]